MPEKELTSLLSEYVKELKHLVSDLVDEQDQTRKKVSDVVPRIEQKLLVIESEFKHMQTRCDKCEERMEGKIKNIEIQFEKKEEQCRKKAEEYSQMEKSFNAKTEEINRLIIKVIAWATGFGAALGMFGKFLWEHLTGKG